MLMVIWFVGMSLFWSCTVACSGQFHCPVTFKVFNENTHIVAVKATGNVYAYECIERLNLKPKNLRDLLTDEPFLRSDVIDIQVKKYISWFNLVIT